MTKLRRRIPKTVRLLPAIDHLVREIAVLEADYRFLTEAEVLEAATQLGALVLAAQVYGRGGVMEAISREEVLGRLRLELASVWAMVQPSGRGRAAPEAAMDGGASAPSSPPSGRLPAAPPPVAHEAAAIVSSFGGTFLEEDD